MPMAIPRREDAKPGVSATSMGFFPMRLARCMAHCTASSLVAPVRTTAQALRDPQFEINGLLVDGGQIDGKPLRFVGSPLRLGETPAVTGRPAPSVGQHTDEVLAAAGFGTDEIASLRATNAIS